MAAFRRAQPLPTSHSGLPSRLQQPFAPMLRTTYRNLMFGRAKVRRACLGGTKKVKIWKETSCFWKKLTWVRSWLCWGERRPLGGLVVRSCDVLASVGGSEGPAVRLAWLWINFLKKDVRNLNAERSK